MDVHYPPRPNGLGIVHISGSGWYAPTAYSAAALKDRLEPCVPALTDAGYTVFAIRIVHPQPSCIQPLWKMRNVLSFHPVQRD